MASAANQNYTVLARRFRPQTFDEVVGQEHVGQAIRNAIRSNRVAHAYLFTGARGVGKTSTARIFAKALNCPHVVDAIPCNECDVCSSIGEGQDVDVQEIDGASNRGIDDIRQLRAKVNVKSMRSLYKIYIIDEVHMLTKEAFNALLKTLEEPPANVKFVFCTTEPEKVPDTILSRCQRFDFGTIAQESIAGRLKQIATAEGKTVEDEAIELVARRAGGSMRDSQSLFDQLLAFGGEKITTVDVHQLLGTAADDRLIEIVDAILTRNSQSCLEMVDELLLRGAQIGSFSDQLLAYLRDLMVTAAGARTVHLSAVSNSVRHELERQAQHWGMPNITAAMQILAETKFKMQRVNYGRALLEVALVRISLLEDLSLITALARSVAEGKPLPIMNVSSPNRGVSQSIDTEIVHSQESLKKKGTFSEKNDDETSPSLHRVDSAQNDQSHCEFSDATLSEFWESLTSYVPENLAAHLKNAVSRAISGPNVLEIRFPKSYLFSKNYCERFEPLKKIAEVAKQLTGQEITCRFVVDESQPAPAPRQQATRQPVRRSPSSVDGDQFVQDAIAIFSGQVVEVRPVFVTVDQPTFEG